MEKLRELNETLSKNGISMVFEMNDLNDKLKDLSPIEIGRMIGGYIDARFTSRRFH